MEREDAIAGKAREEPVAHHRACAAETFLGRLEDEVDGAGEVGIAREVLRGAEQHRGVPVVAAGVHLVLVHRGVREVVLLLQVQRVHVGAQADRLLAGPAALQRADHARGGEAAMDLDAPALQPGGDDLGGAPLLEGGLGMAMDVAADRGQVGLIGGELVRRQAAHDRFPSMKGGE
mgnify:CR=1 FL=1